MNLEKEIRIYSLSLVIVGICIGVVLMIIYYKVDFFDFPSEEIYIDGNCTDLNLENSIDCLREEVRQFYYYNETNKNNLLLSEEKFKEEGGVCWQYVEYYLKRANEIGLYGRDISFWSDGSTNRKGEEDYVGHSVAFIWDKNFTGYCLLDQLNVECFKYNNLNAS